MKKKTKRMALLALLVLLVVGFIFLIRFVFGGPEDTWLCRDGEWVKHGQPATAPTGSCPIN